MPSQSHTPVSEAQIRALVTAARCLRDRLWVCDADGGTAAAGDRLLRLDWAVQAGQVVLADRAAQGLAPPSRPRQDHR